MANTNNLPVCVMSFDRPDYLRATLTSLRDQSAAVGEVHLFQDNAVNFFSGERRAADEKIEESVGVFAELFPDGHVHMSDQNIGTGLNFERAEQYVFNERGFANAVFLEDDMVLGPFYLATLAALFDYADCEKSGNRIGYVAAYGNHRADLTTQRANEKRLIPMGHSWGFGLRRTHWADIREIMEPYIDVLRNCDYRDRPLRRISEIYFELGLAAAAMSQDAFKQIATSYVGRVRIMPFICQAQYVGRSGSNFNEQIFSKMGYGSEKLYATPPSEFDWLGEESLIEQLESDRARFSRLCADRCAAIAPAKPRDIYVPSRPSFKAPGFIKVFSPKSRNPALLPDSENGRLLADEISRALSIDELVAACHEGSPRLSVHSSGHRFKGWISTERQALDLMDFSKWEFFFRVHGIQAVRLEHVINCYTTDEAHNALKNIHEFLLPGGHIRIAVPDMNFPDPAYRTKIESHASRWRIDSLTQSLETLGFLVRPLEYFDDGGEFRMAEWQPEDGQILRSRFNDARNNDDTIAYTSLIVDAVKAD
ncbi:MAG: hypothetical protein AAFY26_03140 [Cyanobacteria bacterium J06638_22]